MMIVPSGTTALTPGLLARAPASAAGIVAATALRSESFVTLVAPTWFSCVTSGAWIDAAAASRACRWVRFAGRLASWLLNTTTMRSGLPAVRALTWLGLNLEKLGFITAALGLEPAADAAPVITTAPSVAAPTNDATFRLVKDIPLPPFGALPGSRALDPTPHRRSSSTRDRSSAVTRRGSGAAPHAPPPEPTVGIVQWRSRILAL